MGKKIQSQKERARKEAMDSVRKRKETFDRARADDADALMFLGHKWLGQELNAEDAERLAKDDKPY